MADVSKHHTEQEWERCDSKQCRVHFLVPRDPVSVHDLLKRECKIVQVEVGWRFGIERLALLELPKRHDITSSLADAPQRHFNTLFFALQE
jgi:hypothetical protein